MLNYVSLLSLFLFNDISCPSMVDKRFYMFWNYENLKRNTFTTNYAKNTQQNNTIVVSFAGKKLTNMLFFAGHPFVRNQK